MDAEYDPGAAGPPGELEHHGSSDASESTTSSWSLPRSAASSSPQVDQAAIIRRTKSLSELQTLKASEARTGPKPHPLQMIPRRASFHGEDKNIPALQRELILGYDKDGIHTCRHCQKVSIHLRSSTSRFNPKSWFRTSAKGNLGVTYREARQAAIEGCPLFLSMDGIQTSDPCVDIIHISKGRSLHPKIPEELLDESVEYDLSRDGVLAANAPRVYFATRRRLFNTYWLLYCLDGTQGHFQQTPAICSSFLEAISSPQRWSRLRPEPFTDSENSWKTARLWLEACNKDHKCLRSKQNFMPLRLIQINSRDPLRRITVVHCTRAVHYAALSYCWGGGLRFKTTSHSLASVQAGIPSEVLPQTVQDAVSVALELGLQYLWVDSLCIVQDDEDEMTDQIAQMAKIFEGAYITIAASQAARSSDGFLSLRNPFSLVCRVKIAHRDRENLRYGVGRPVLHSFGEQPLASRAWTLQEIFLSRRILSFEHGHMHWYCLQDAKGNCSQPVVKFSMDGLNPGFDGKWLHGMRFSKIPSVFKRRTFPFFKFHRIGFQSVSEWIEIVHEYSRRQLTCGSDKLLAISAVAERFSRCAWGRYFAGMCEKDLLSQCTWEIFDWPTHSRYRTPGVPSWSWASVPNSLSWKWDDIGPDATHATACQVISAHVDLVSPNAPFGDVRGGELVLEGRMKLAVVVPHFHYATIYDLLDGNVLRKGRIVGKFKLDYTLQLEGKMLLSCLEILPFHEVGKFDYRGLPKEKRFQKYIATALILQYDSRTGHYHRVGCFIESIPDPSAEDLEEVQFKENWWSTGWETKRVTIV